MGDHTNCSDWDYATHPNRDLVTARCAFVLKIFRAQPRRFNRYGLVTKAGHSYIFKGMAPVFCEYFVGNYRGSDFPCLKGYRVGVPADPRVGTQPSLVNRHMHEFEAQLMRALGMFVKAANSPAAKARPDLLLLKFVSIVALFLQKFLTIHPYANGNGHMGRLLVWILLGRFEYWPAAWPLDASPSYGEALSKHRKGEHAPLNDFLLKCIRG